MFFNVEYSAYNILVRPDKIYTLFYNIPVAQSIFRPLRKIIINMVPTVPTVLYKIFDVIMNFSVEVSPILKFTLLMTEKIFKEVNANYK